MCGDRSVVIGGGAVMPLVGLGLWKVTDAEKTTYDAIRAGYRLLDEAADYGNEKECGKGIARAVKEGIVERKDLFITSKLWNTYHRKEHVRQACLKTLQDLGVEYLDLYLIHFPIALKFVPFEKKYPPEWFNDQETDKMVYDPVPYSETWRAMEELVKEGLVKNIGMCNIGIAMLRDVLSYAEIKPAVLQVELHPFLTQDKLLRFCKASGIAVTGFSNLGAASYFQLGMAQKSEAVLDNQAVLAIANAHNKTPAQIVLRWGIQRGTAIVPKSENPQRLAENIDIFSFVLTETEMRTISSLNVNRRFNDPGEFCEKAFGTFFPIYE